MEGGAGLADSSKSGIWDGIDAPNMAEGVPNAMTQRQRITVHERRKERRCLAPGIGDCGIGVGGSIYPSPFLSDCDNHELSKGDAILCGETSRIIEAGFLQNQTIPRLTTNGPEMTGKKTLQQRAEVEGVAYAEKVRMGDRFRL